MQKPETCDSFDKLIRKCLIKKNYYKVTKTHVHTLRVASANDTVQVGPCLDIQHIG